MTAEKYRQRLLDNLTDQDRELYHGLCVEVGTELHVPDFDFFRYTASLGTNQEKWKAYILHLRRRGRMPLTLMTHEPRSEYQVR